MKVLLRVLTVVLVLVIGFLTYSVANKGERSLSEAPSTSATVSPSLTVSPSPSESPSTEPTAYTGATNPLTGLPADESIINNRPYAVMINNYIGAMPQLGTSKADIIYEIAVEGGITRMMALFQDISGIGEIGSIRSARPYFVDIALGHDAIYIHAGGSGDAYEELKSTAITSLDGVWGSRQDIFFRDKERRKTMSSEHTLVTTSELISQYLPTYNLRLEHKSGFENGMMFADNGTPVSAQAAENITVHFSASKTTAFKYSADDGLYSASQYKGAYLDGNDNTQIAVTNLLILRTDIWNIPGDTAGRLAMDVTGTGTGTFYCGGKYVPITWTKKANSTMYAFRLEDGTELVFGRGRTYICIITDNNKVDIT